MTGGTVVEYNCIADKINEYNKFFSENYYYLTGFSKSINPGHDYLSLCHDSYLQGLNRITLSGFSGSSYLNFIRVIIMNKYKRNYRDNRRYENTEFTSTDEIEYTLQLQSVWDEIDSERQYKNMYLNTMTYEYVNKYFNARDNMIFKTYYLLQDKNMNYKTLSICTGYSQASVSKIIRKIKKSLREGLMCYIKTNLNVMELADTIKKVEAVLAKPLNRNLGEYKAMYITVFGQPFRSSCSCQINKIRTALQDWLVKNKIVLAEEQQKISK